MLLFLSLIPLIGALYVLFSRDLRRIVDSAIMCMLITFAVSLLIFYLFDTTFSKFQFVTGITWNNSIVFFGVDGMSILFVLLTTYLIPLCAYTLDSIHFRKKEFIFLLLLIEFFLILVFTTLNLLLFYIFFEALLIPMFIIIGVWGSRSRKIRAAYLFFLYTLAGSLFLLLSILFLLYNIQSLDIRNLFLFKLSLPYQKILWLAFFLSFAVKIPMVPFHIWLPEAHVEAPTSGSILLAGILLKLGGYGFIRFSLTLFPEASYYYTPLIYVLCFFSIIYISLITLVQVDVKRIIAYSSIAHMNLVVLGIFSDNQSAIQSSIFLMIGHGIVSGGLFFLIGTLYSKVGSRLLYYLGGFARSMPIFTLFFFILTMANIALPGTINFMGEFLILQNLFRNNNTIAFLVSFSVILGAAYSLLLMSRLCFGDTALVYHNNTYKLSDLSLKDSILCISLSFFTIFFGIYPAPILNVLSNNIGFFL